MGCCSSKAKEGQEEDKPGPVVGTVFDYASSIGGTKFQPSAAAFATYGQSGKLQSFNRVIVTEEQIFACLLDGYGGGEAANHLLHSAYETFQSALVRCAGDVTKALEVMIQDMDDALMLASKAAPDKAATGAGAAIAVVDLKSQQVHAVTVGGCICLVARASGSFNHMTVEMDVLADGRKAREALQPLRRMKAPDWQILEQSRMHVLGYGIGKSKQLAYTYARPPDTVAQDVIEPAPSLQCQVGSASLVPGDEHVLLLSGGFLDLLSCSDAAGLAHEFNTSELQRLLEAAIASQQAALQEGSPEGSSTKAVAPADSRGGPSHGGRFNVSEILANHALSTLRSKSTKGRSGADLLLSDVAVVSIALDFPKSMSTQRSGKQRVADAMKLRNPKVAYRWQVIRRFARFGIHRKRAILKMWWEITSAIETMADAAAREMEQVYWKHMNQAVQVTRTGLVMAPGAQGGATPKSQGQPMGQRLRTETNQSPSIIRTGGSGSSRHRSVDSRASPSSTVKNRGSFTGHGGGAAAPGDGEVEVGLRQEQVGLRMVGDAAARVGATQA